MLAVVDEPRRLVSSGEAARQLGIDRSTLGRWVASGAVKPASRTVGRQYRWDLEDLRRQVAERELEREQERERGRGD